MNSKNTDDTPSVSRGRHSRIEVGDGRSFLEFQDAMKVLTTTISGKWQSRIRGRRKSRLRGSVFVHFKRHVRFAPPHRYRENGNRRDAPSPPRGRHYGRVTRDFITVTQPRQPAIAHCISRVMQMQARVTQLYTASRDPY